MARRGSLIQRFAAPARFAARIAIVFESVASREEVYDIFSFSDMDLTILLCKIDFVFMNRLALELANAPAPHGLSGARPGEERLRPRVEISVRDDGRERAAACEAPPSKPARVSVVIASMGRKAALHETVKSILAQSSHPREIILALPSLEHVDPRTMVLPSVRVILSPPGSCRQRNEGIAAVGQVSDYIAFFDDDVELCADYLKTMCDMLESRPDVVLATGCVLADGAKIGGIDRKSAAAIVSGVPAEATPDCLASVAQVRGAYGCNMVVRRAALGDVRFDERLPLYGWLEDFDFSMRLAERGSVVKFEGARMVHLAERGGRTSGYRLGYSQIVNPFYISRKAGRIGLGSLVRQYWAPVLLRNGFSIGSRMRRERFVGNLLGIWMLATGRVQPEHILKMK